MAQPVTFRETMWFKRGALAEAAPVADATDDEVPPPAELPIEDRYGDDGTLTPADRARFGLHTGATAYLPRVEEAPLADADDGALPALVRELKRTRRVVLAAIGAAVAAGLVLAISGM